MFKITLTSARVNAGFSIEDIAKKLHKSKQTIINWEKGKTPLKVTDFEKLCQIYKIPRDYIKLP